MTNDRTLFLLTMNQLIDQLAAITPTALTGSVVRTEGLRDGNQSDRRRVPAGAAGGRVDPGPHRLEIGASVFQGMSIGRPRGW